MAEIFRTSNEKTAERCRASVEDFEEAGAEKIAKQAICVFKNQSQLQSCDLGSFRPGRHRAKLTVLAPCRFPLLVGTKITGGQTIPSKYERL